MSTTYGAMNVLNDSRVQKALRRLRAMGLRVTVLTDNIYEGYIFIDLESIKTMIARQMKYPHKSLHLESGQLVIQVWKER